MFNRIPKFLRKEVFSFIDIITKIKITKISKEYINNLEIKKQMNMINFCKIYYQNDNRKPSLYILLKHFKSLLSKVDFISIYTYFMNNYIQNHSNELIEFELLLDTDIIGTIINNKLLNTNKISLKITSLNLLFDKNLDFQNSKNIEQIIFNGILEESDFTYILLNKLYIDSNIYYEIYYLLILKYFKRLIPKNIRTIGISSIQCSDFINNINEEKLSQILQTIGVNKENLNIESMLNLVYNELSQYTNIKIFGLESENFNSNFSLFLNALKNAHPFLQNLDEINIDNDVFLDNNEKISSFKELINKEHLKQKLSVENIKIGIDLYEKVKDILDIVKYKRLTINGVEKYKNDKIKVNFSNNLRMVQLNNNLYDFEIFKQMNNLEILQLYKTIEDCDYSLFKYLTNLKELEIFELHLSNDNELDNLFKIFNKYNQKLKKLKIGKFKLKKMLYQNEIKLNTPIELKNLKIFSFKYYFDRKYNNFFNHFIINAFNIDKCTELEEIRVPFYFECNNITVLNNLKRISINLLDTTNIKFLSMILNCKNLDNLYIRFLLPFKNYNILNYLYDNLGKIRKLECELQYNTIKNIIEKNDEINEEEIKNYNSEYINKINNIFKSKKLEYIETLFVFPRSDDYDVFKNLKYHDKNEFLKNFPNIETYGYINLESQYLYSKIDFSKEKYFLSKYFGA